jgi:hypothetical protein
MFNNSQQLQFPVLTNAAGEQVIRSNLEQYRDNNGLASNMNGVSPFYKGGAQLSNSQVLRILHPNQFGEFVAPTQQDAVVTKQVGEQQNDTTFGEYFDGSMQEELPSLGTDQIYLNADKTFTDSTSKLKIRCYEHGCERDLPNNTTEVSARTGGNLGLLKDVIKLLQNSMPLLRNSEYRNGLEIEITFKMSDAVSERTISYESTFDEVSVALLGSDSVATDEASAQ